MFTPYTPLWVLISPPGRYADCVASVRRMIERSPEAIAARYFLIAAAAMHGDTVAAAEAVASLLRLRPEFSLKWLSKNMAWAEEVGERLLAGLRKAGLPAR